MSEPRWLTTAQVIRIHAEQLAIFGGPPGLRDAGMLESALGRPVNKWTYGETNLAGLAAAYAYGIARNHLFVDGNKRAAFMVMIVFLRKNGIAFAPREAEATEAILGLASGEIEEEGLARWIRDNWPVALRAQDTVALRAPDTNALRAPDADTLRAPVKTTPPAPADKPQSSAPDATAKPARKPKKKGPAN